MSIQWNKKGALFPVLGVFLFFCSCSKNTRNNESIERYVNNDKLVIEKVFKNISPPGNHFLVVPKDLCRKCFRQIIDYFEQQDEQGQIVLVGGNDYDVQRLNAIYQNSLKFWKGKLKQYEQFQSKYPAMIRGYVRYVEINSDTLIYEGVGETLTERTKDVLDHFVKRDGSNG